MARNIRVTLDLDTGNFNVQVRNATGRFIDLDQAIRRAGGSLGATERQARNTLGTLRDLTVVAGQARNAFLNLRDAVFGWVGPIINANREVQRASVLLQGMSRELTEVGRRTEAADNLRSLLNLAKSSPFSLDALTNSFVKMKSGGLDPLDGSMKSLVDAVATFGGDSQILNRASIAIQQMSGKGVISMEELRQQLGEAVPTAINLMARSLGVSYEELVDKISKGQVKASGALRRMFGEFERTFGGAAARMVNTFDGALARAQTTLIEFALSVGGFQNGQFIQGGFMQTLTDGINAFTDAVGSAEARKFGEVLGSGLTTVINALRDLARFLIQNIDLIVAIGRAMLIAFAGQLVVRGMTGIANMFGNMMTAARNFGGELARAQRGIAIMSTQIGRATTAGNIGAISFNRMAVAVRTLGRAFLNMIPFVGQAVLAITTVADVLGLFRDRAKEAKTAFEDFSRGIVTQEGLEAARAEIETLEDRLAYLTKKEAGKVLKAFSPQGNVYEKFTEADKEELDKVLADLADKTDKWQTAVNNFAIDIGKQQGEAAVRYFENQRQQLNADYNRTAEELQRARDQIQSDEEMSELMKSDGLEQIRQQEIQNVENYYRQMVGMAELRLAEIQKLQDDYAAANTMHGPNERGVDVYEQDMEGMKARTRVFEEYVEGLRRSRQNALADLKGPLDVFIEGNGDGDGSKISAAQRKIIQLTGDIAKLKGGYNTVTAAVDEFNAELDEGAYPKITEAEIERIRALITEKEQLDITRQAQDSLNDVLEEGTKAHEDARVAMDSLWNGGVERSATAVENFRQKLVEMTNKMRDATGETKEWQLAVASIAGAVNSFSIGRQAQVLDGIRAANEEAKVSLMSLSERREYEYERERERVFRLIDLNAFAGEERKRVEEMVYGYLGRLRNEQKNAVLLSIQRQFEGWRDLNQNIADGISGWVDQMIDSLVQGEFSFGKFAKAVLADIARIIMRATIANAIIAALGSFGGPPQLSQGDMEYSINSPSFHTGGTVGLNTTNKRVSGGLFANAMRYHTGGIAGLKPDEVPAILRKGERVSTEQQWKQLHSGGGGNESVQVNLINQSGTPLSSDRASTRFDGKQMILDVVIDAMNKPGKMRETVKSVK